MSYQFKGRVSYSWVIILIGMLSIFGASGLGRHSYPVILPSMKEGLKLTYSQTGLLNTGYFLGYLLFSSMGGILAAKYRPRMVITFSLFLVGNSLLLTGLAPNFASALIFRFLTGMGTGGVNIPMVSLPALWFDQRKWGLAAGIMWSGSSLGLILTGLVIPTLLLFYGPQGWRYCWYYLGLINLAICGLAYCLIRDSPQRKVATTSKRLYLGLVYKNRSLWHLALVYFLFGLSYFIYMTFFVTYLIKEGGLSPARAGNIWSFMGIFTVVSGLIWGSLSDRLGRKYALIMIFGIQALSYFLLTSVRTLVIYYTSALLTGITALGIATVMTAAAGDYAGPKLASAVLGLVTIAFGIGSALGPALGGFIADVTGSFFYALLLSALIAVMGLISALTLKPPLPPPPKSSPKL